MSRRVAALALGVGGAALVVALVWVVREERRRFGQGWWR